MQLWNMILHVPEVITNLRSDDILGEFSEQVRKSIRDLNGADALISQNMHFCETLQSPGR